MTCSVRPREMLPHQGAHWACPRCGEVLAVCFDCGTSSIRPDWESEDRELVPAYVQLGVLIRQHEAKICETKGARTTETTETTTSELPREETT